MSNSVESRNNNDADDDAVFAVIRSGGRRAADAMASLTGKDAYRRTDRALQRLRKRGRIEFVKGSGWSVCR